MTDFQKSFPQITSSYLRKIGSLYSNPHDYLKSRHIDTLAKGLNVCFSFSVLSIIGDSLSLDIR